MANSLTVSSAFEWLMGLTGIEPKTPKAGTLWWLPELNLSIESQHCPNSINSMTVDNRQFGCFQIWLKIKRIWLQWKCIVQRKWILHWRDLNMQSRQMATKLRRMRCTGWYKLHCIEWLGGGKKHNLQVWHHWFRFCMWVYTSWILSGLRKSKYHCKPLWKGTNCKVFQMAKGYMIGR